MQGFCSPHCLCQGVCQQLGLGGCHAMRVSGRTVHGTGLGMGCRGWSGPALSNTLPSGFAKGMWQQGCSGWKALVGVLPSSSCCGSGCFCLLSKFVFQMKMGGAAPQGVVWVISLFGYGALREGSWGQDGCRVQQELAGMGDMGGCHLHCL